MIEQRVRNLNRRQRKLLANRLQSVLPKVKRVVAWYTTEQGEERLESELRQELVGRLSSQTTPHMFVHCETFPRTSSGKVDRQLLTRDFDARTQNAVHPSSAADERHADSEVVSVLRRIWAEVLGTSQFSNNDNFFEVGGDSLGLIKVIALAGDAGWIVTPGQFHEFPTIHGLAETIETPISIPAASAGAIAERQAVRPAISSNSKLTDETTSNEQSTARSSDPSAMELGLTTDQPVLFFIPPQGVAVSGFRHTVNAIRGYSCVAPVTVEKNSGERFSVEELAEAFLMQIRERQSSGPYRLIGTCEGAYIAWELAQRLTQAGEVVQFLGIIDTPNPDGMKLRPLSERFRNRLDQITVRSPVQFATQIVKRTVSWIRRRTQQALTKEKHLTRAGSRMGWNYSPQPYAARATLFRAGKLPSGTDFESDFSNGWGQLPALGLDVYTLPCTRQEMLEAPFANQLARLIESALQNTSLEAESELKAD